VNTVMQQTNELCFA